MMEEVIMGFGVLVIVFLLVIFLGLQIQISSLSRRIDEFVERIKKE